MTGLFETLGLGASVTADPAAAADRAVKALRVEILKVKPESDGYTLDVRDDAGTVYRAVISPANLGPDSGFDFDHIKVGHPKSFYPYGFDNLNVIEHVGHPEMWIVRHEPLRIDRGRLVAFRGVQVHNRIHPHV